MDTPPSPTALGLTAAAAAASGPVPGDPVERARWLADVAELAAALYRPSQDVEAVLAEYAKCRVVRGVILEAKEQVGQNGPTGRGLVVIKPTMGEHADDPDATEPMRTPWLNERRGASLLAQAVALAGTGIECRFGKWNDTIDGGTQKGKKRGMVAWLEPTGRGTPPGTERPPQPQASRSAPPPNGTRPSAVPPGQAPALPATADIVALRNVKITGHEQLWSSATAQLGVDKERVGAVEMELFGAKGAQSPVQLARVWNELITRSLQPA